VHRLLNIHKINYKPKRINSELILTHSAFASQRRTGNDGGLWKGNQNKAMTMTIRWVMVRVRVRLWVRLRDQPRNLVI